MLEKKSSKGLLAIILAFTAFSSFGQIKFMDAIDSAKVRSSYIVVAEINRGEILQTEEIDCGGLYHASVQNTLHGQSERTQIAFFSSERLMIGANYIIFLEKGNLFELPASVVAVEHQPVDISKKCKNGLVGDAATLWTGLNPVVLEVIRPSFDRDTNWVIFDGMRYILSSALTTRYEDVEQCELELETLEPRDCALVSRRTLVPVDEFLELLKE
ncbi:hypothetical protein [Aliidiomarina haloalkalitolerans]|uniref:Uncharacterized protein n=1 Tax=Aliidiomarina haloalkalitolerans TaxID=859059 RepID=A0A432VPE9_9GAMM|nr:hypothetical protein [Aliidiomarina haloalkalitolerans]RUO17987.1 hypothetical protein CWE06_12310 [Aliidiomarina haloalkalitolerans]